MRPTVRLAALASLASLAAPLAAAPLVAQAPFEGVVTIHTNEGQGQDAQYYVRQGMTRVEMNTARGQMAIIMDRDKQTQTMLIPDRQMYVTRPMMRPGMGPVTKDAPEPKVERTGKKETVAGVECEHYSITTERGASDVCLAPSLGAFPGFGGPMGGRRGGGAGGAGGPGGGGMGAGWRAALGGDNTKLGFPLKVVENGTTVMEVTKVEKKTLDPSMFQVPAGYQQMQMPMGGGTGGPPGGAPPGGGAPPRSR